MNKPHKVTKNWRQHLKAQQDSDLSISEYCRLHNINNSTFSNWRAKSKLKQESAVGFSKVVSEAPEYSICLEFSTGLKIHCNQWPPVELLEGLS